MEGVSCEGEWGDTGQKWPRVKPRGIPKVWVRVGGYGWNTQTQEFAQGLTCHHKFGLFSVGAGRSGQEQQDSHCMAGLC